MATAALPVQETERINSLDTLRGFALLGILVMNIWAFAMPFGAYFNPHLYGDMTGANWWAWFLSHLLFELKFLSLFSIMFGAGVYLMTSRLESRGQKSGRWHYRRMGWLTIFGIVHGYLLWMGDILYLYGVCGFLIFLFRKMSPRKLLAIGMVAILIGSLIPMLMGWSMPYWPESERQKFETENWQMPPEKLQREVDTYRNGWWSQVKFRAPFVFMFQTFYTLIWGIWRAGGLMLVGMALLKWGVLSMQKSPAFYAWLAVVGLAIGLPMTAYGVQQNYAHNWAADYSFFFGSQYNYWGSLLTAAGYIGVVMLLCRAGGWLVRSLAAVGRMAFSNYLLHTLICTTIFYGYGLGLFGEVSRVGQDVLVLLVWIFQLVMSPIWLRHFHFGPLEWLWRSLTYGQAQPFRRAAPAAAPAIGS